MSSNFEKLKAKLLELFMLDQPDLDFGIFRIMNSKRQEITQFLDNDLLPQVKQAFAQYQQSDKSHLQAELDKAVEQAKELGVNPDESKKVQELKAKLVDSVDLTALENEVYSDLYNFFRRYYKEGDFLSLRRYKEGVYAIPYEGEEVKLYWANNDQYYIKTSEYLKDYTFSLPNGKKVHFKLAEADVEKDNIKATTEQERRFVLVEENPICEENDELIIRFNYLSCEKKNKQKDLNEKALETIFAAEGLDGWISTLSTKMPTDKNPNRTLVEKHLTDYTARHTFDYFIHKDLGSFLRRELDFYIKNEIMHLDDVESESAPKVEQYLSRIKVIRQIAHKIIRFLEQLENFQKRLWLKKKFVVETHYCVTLDRVPEELYPEIVANDAQRQDWVELFSIDQIKAEKLGEVNYSNQLTVDFLKANPHLVLDTAFFDERFKEKLIASIDNIDEQTDGLLIHSENLQALNILQKRFKEQVNCIYIDPPYNTDSTPILYKNDYKHSSWVTLLCDRVRVASSLLTYRGVSTTAIDDVEMANLSKLFEEMFPERRLSRITVVHNPKGSITKDFNRVHEYALVLTREDVKECIARTLEENETPRKMRRWGENSLRTERRLSFYPIYVKNDKVIRIGEVPNDDFHPTGRNVELPTGEIEIWPIDQNGIERRWNFGLDTIEDNFDRITIQEVDNTLDLFLTHEMTVPKTVWSGGDYDAGNWGNTLLIDILGSKKFDFPKSIHLVKRCVYLVTSDATNSIVLDYFAGSGTTGHAVINMNREDQGSRKYILVEMGQYFDTVLKPRVQKVIYSKDWKKGKPENRDSGISHMFKYIRLESYEDCLNNLILQRTKDQQSLLEASQEFRESYMLGYMLDTEAKDSASLLNIDAFEDPFNYKLNIATGSVGETKPVNVDLVETFNYLLGLRVKHIDTIRGYKVVEGYSPRDEKVLVIWRNTKEKSNEDLEDFVTRQQYNTLDMEFDLIYVNGDNNLENLKKDEDIWKVRLIEEEFQRLMFDVQDV